MATGTVGLLAPRVAPRWPGASSLDSASVFLFSVSFSVLSVSPFVNVTVASVASVPSNGRAEPVFAPLRPL